jgi:transcriptional regulator with XRE-family HTH domain
MSNGTTFFGQWLRQRRRSFDLTQTELARLVSCSAISIRKLEMGERRPSRQMACLLADKLGIAAEERAAFIRFARTDEGPEMFRHPLFVEPANATPFPESDELATPEALFPADFSGWIKMVSDETLPARSSTLLSARFHCAPVDSPRRETLSDGRLLFNICMAGRIAGGINGTMGAEINELVKTPVHQPGCIVNSTVLFNIVTDAGRMKAYCIGYTTPWSETGSAHHESHGKICAVSDTYADLFLADVYCKVEVITAPNGIKGQGVVTFVPG